MLVFLSVTSYHFGENVFEYFSIKFKQQRTTKMLKICKAVTEQTTALSSIDFAEVHTPSPCHHFTDF